MMGMFAALAMIFGYVEALLPLSIGIPGVKLGIANIVVVFALYRLRPSEALLINVIRILLTGFLFGNLSMTIYSLAGAIFSFFGMLLVKNSGKFSIYGVSVVGGVCHNLGQLLVAMLVLETLALIYYGPVLLICGLVTGILIGILGNEVLKRIGTF